MKTLKSIYTVVTRYMSLTGRSFLSYAESMGRAKAAAELSRAGYHKEAREILMKN
jgi:hypothetical protein